MNDLEVTLAEINEKWKKILSRLDILLDDKKESVKNFLLGSPLGTKGLPLSVSKSLTKVVTWVRDLVLLMREVPRECAPAVAKTPVHAV